MFDAPINSLISPMRAVWVPDILANQAGFNGMLSYAASHMIYITGNIDIAHPLSYKLSAIKCINERLADPELATSDETIAAVSRQINLEVCGR